MLLSSLGSMQEIKVNLHQSPVPHVIIENFYTEEELSLIWKELDSLTIPQQMHIGDHTAKYDNGELKSKSMTVGLDNIYENNINASNILTINRKIFDFNLLKTIASVHPLMSSILRCNKDGTMIRYYENHDEYAAHFDNARFTAISYFYKEPKAFSGGDLFFNEFNYTIPTKNNTVVIFMGCSIEHGSTKLIMNENYKKLSGFGKYSMVQFMKQSNEN